MKTKQAITFAEMPRDYAALCGVFLPRPIHDRVGYGNTVEIADVFAGFEHQMSADQNDYLDLLCDLIEKFDQETLPPPDSDGLDVLRLLVDEHGITGAGLSRILGRSVAVGPMILRGERQITAAHAVRLGQHFGLRADVFLSTKLSHRQKVGKS